MNICLKVVWAVSMWYLSIPKYLTKSFFTFFFIIWIWKLNWDKPNIFWFQLWMLFPTLPSSVCFDLLKPRRSTTNATENFLTTVAWVFSWFSSRFCHLLIPTYSRDCRRFCNKMPRVRSRFFSLYKRCCKAKYMYFFKFNAKCNDFML